MCFVCFSNSLFASNSLILPILCVCCVWLCVSVFLCVFFPSTLTFYSLFVSWFTYFFFSYCLYVLFCSCLLKILGSGWRLQEFVLSLQTVRRTFIIQYTNTRMDWSRNSRSIEGVVRGLDEIFWHQDCYDPGGFDSWQMCYFWVEQRPLLLNLNAFRSARILKQTVPPSGGHLSVRRHTCQQDGAQWRRLLCQRALSSHSVLASVWWCACRCVKPVFCCCLATTLDRTDVCVDCTNSFHSFVFI